MWPSRHAHGVQSFHSPCSFATEVGTVGLSNDVSPRITEDRFIGTVDYQEFSRESRGALWHSSDDPQDARYRRILESCIGLTGTGHTLLHGGDYHRFSRSRDGDGDRCFSPACGATDVSFPVTPNPYRTVAVGALPPSSPGGCRRPFVLQERERSFLDAEGAYQRPEQSKDSHAHHLSPMGSRVSTPLRRAGAPGSLANGTTSGSSFIALATDHREGCHTPVRPPRETAGFAGFGNIRAMDYTSSVHNAVAPAVSLSSVRRAEGPFSPAGPRESLGGTPRAPSISGDAHRTTPVAVLRTPVMGPRASTSDPPQLRTPVIHENDLLCTSTFDMQMRGFGASANSSPLLRRSALYSQRTTLQRQTETNVRAFVAQDICLCNDSRQYIFSPLCWGYPGLVIALRDRIVIWQSCNKEQCLFQAPVGFGLVSAVASSRQPTDNGDAYVAYGMEEGLIVVIRCPVWEDTTSFPGRGAMEGCGGWGDVMFQKASTATFREHMSPVSTLQVVGHKLYTGSAGGILTIVNLRDSSLQWCGKHVVPPENIVRRPQSVVNVGAPIYRLEVSPDEEHIAVGTNNSLLLFQTSRMWPEDGSKRRVIWSNAPHPVRAFCWWTFPISERCNAAPETFHNKQSSFFQSLLLYGGGADGSVLTLYSIGSRPEKAVHHLPAPICGIVGSETSGQILVSFRPAGVEPLESAPQGPPSTGNARPLFMAGGGEEEAAALGSGGLLDTVDNSSDEGDIRHVIFVDRHHPFSGTGGNSHNPNVGGSTFDASLAAASGRAEGFPPLPTGSHPRRPAKSSGLLQMYQLRVEGHSLEKLSDYSGLRDSPLHLALSPDNTQLATVEVGCIVRIWQAFRTKMSSHVDPCQFR